MADPAGVQYGIRAPENTIRAPSILRKENYRSWAMKLKAALKVMECWRLVEGTEVSPPATAAAGASAAELRAALAAKALWDKKCDRASSLLVSSVSDDEIGTIYGFDDDPVAIWARLRDKFERRSEAEAESAQMELLEFTHKEGETANATIDRFDAAVKYCEDQGVTNDENHLKRMLLRYPAERYEVLKQSYLLAPAAARPDLDMLKSQLRDIDDLHQKKNAGKRGGQANQAESAWGDGGYGSGRGRGRGRQNGRGNRGGRGGRGDGGGSGGSYGGGRGGQDIQCYCCGEKGHIRPKCPKRDSVCHKCKHTGHLQSMCKGDKPRDSGNGGGGSSGGYGGYGGGPKNPEAGQFDTMYCEAMMLSTGGSGSENKWMADPGSSHHLKGDTVGMFDI